MSQSSMLSHSHHPQPSAQDISSGSVRGTDPAKLLNARVALKGVLLALLVSLCLIPFLLVIAISFGEKIEGAGWHWALDLSNYRRFLVGIDWPDSLSLLYSQKLYWSVTYALSASVLAMLLAFPFTFLMTRQSRRIQTAWLIFLLSAVSLSEVFVVMGWDVLLSNRSGLPMVLRELGFTAWLKENGWFQAFRDAGLANPRDLKFKTSSLATVLTMTYLVWPYAVILLYPPMSRLDDSLMEAASTMGASTTRAITSVVLPTMRLPLIGSTLLLFVFLLGSYVTVSVFAAPARQTLTVSIYESIRGSTLNAPFGAAQSVVLLLVAMVCLGLSTVLTRFADRQR